MIGLEDRTVAEALGEFEHLGYTIAKAEDRAALDAVRAGLVECACEGTLPADPVEFMNRFHEREFKGSALNDYRLRTYRQFNERVAAGELIWKAFRGILTALIGPDVAVQKRVNLVIQPPHDTENAPAHRDAPPNSLFEVVVWVPMVDCYGSKGMQVLDLDQTKSALAFLDGESADYDAYSRYTLEHGRYTDIPYGSALFFWGHVVHAVPTNTEPETRWSLNLRYKSLFAPWGAKSIPDYFRIMQLSPLTRAAMEEERRSRLAAEQ